MATYRLPLKICIIVLAFLSIFFVLVPSFAEKRPIVPVRNLYRRVVAKTASVTKPGEDDWSYFMTPSRRTDRSLDVSLMIVYREGTDMENYATAINSQKCYAKLHNYRFYLFSDALYGECQKHKDLFFRRHCVIEMFMRRELKPDTWLMVLDADIGVVNPNFLIEEFIDYKFDITLFDRFFNYEVGANTYLVRNTEIGRNFVKQFAEYEFRLPASFHGTDNGALHPYLIDLLSAQNSILGKLCWDIWRRSKGYSQLYDMEACARLVMGEKRNFEDLKLRILGKATAWVRDLWLLKSHWSEDDFMMHAVKEKQLDVNRTARTNLPDHKIMQWDPTESNLRTFPVIEKLDLSKCETGEVAWHYDNRLKITNERKWMLLGRMEAKILQNMLKTIGKIANQIPISK